MTRVGAALAAGVLVVGGLTPVSAQAADPPYRPRACETRFSGGDGSDPWQVDRLRIPQLHQIATGKGVTVAVLDTGVFAGSSPYLTGVDLVTKYNFTGTDKATEGRVDCYHGTFVVSLLAAQPGADPNSDFSGIAPDVEVIAMRVLQRSSQSPNDLEPLDPVVDAVNKAVDLGVDIISISQQGTDRADYKAAIKRAVDAGILVVAASGNNGASGPTYPANYPGVMAVAAASFERGQS